MQVQRDNLKEMKQQLRPWLLVEDVCLEECNQINSDTFFVFHLRLGMASS